MDFDEPEFYDSPVYPRRKELQTGNPFAVFDAFYVSLCRLTSTCSVLRESCSLDDSKPKTFLWKLRDLPSHLELPDEDDAFDADDAQFELLRGLEHHEEFDFLDCGYGGF